MEENKSIKQSDDMIDKVEFLEANIQKLKENKIIPKLFQNKSFVPSSNKNNLNEEIKYETEFVDATKNRS